jgi:inosine-uridine nucleoside N-ribohydrolase
VILDCDTANEVDDQFAIAHALGSPAGLDVRGVVSVQNTTAHGPESVRLYQEEAEKVVALCGKGGSVPCLPGAAYPMEDRATPVRSEGLDFIVSELREAPLTLVCTGPATDVASLLLAAPGDVLPGLDVVWLGGFGDEQTYTRYNNGGELNGRADIAAWRMLFEREVELLQVPGWSGPHSITVEAAPFAAELRSMGRPVADYLAEILFSWVSGYEGDLDPGGEKILWDIACVAALTDPDALSISPLAVPALDAAGAHDFLEEARGRRVRSVTSLDPGRVLDGLRAALESLPGRR